MQKNITALLHYIDFAGVKIFTILRMFKQHLFVGYYFD